jgi:hypothetical protein
MEALCQPRTKRSKDRYGKSHRYEEQTCLDGVIPEEGLRKNREQEHGAHHAAERYERDRKHRDDGRILEQFEIDDRMRMTRLPPISQIAEEDGAHVAQEARSRRPTPGLPLIKYHNHRGERTREQYRTEPIECATVDGAIVRQEKDRHGKTDETNRED